MIPAYNIFTAILGIATAVVIIRLVRRDALSANYVLWWFFVAVGLVFVGVFPGVVNYFGQILGIGYPPVILIFLSWCLVLIKLLFMDIDRSRQEHKIRVLMQRLAIYEQGREGRDTRLKSSEPGCKDAMSDD